MGIEEHLQNIRRRILDYLTQGMRDRIYTLLSELKNYSDSTANEFDDWVVDSICEILNTTPEQLNERRKQEQAEKTE